MEVNKKGLIIYRPPPPPHPQILFPLFIIILTMYPDTKNMVVAVYIYESWLLERWGWLNNVVSNVIFGFFRGGIEF